MEHPERCINGIVLRRLPTVRETIGNQAHMCVRSKCFEQSTRLLIPACTNQQSRQRNHTISSPVGKPGIAGNDRLQVSRMLSLLGIWLAVLSVRWTSNNKLIRRTSHMSKFEIL